MTGIEQFQSKMPGDQTAMLRDWQEKHADGYLLNVKTANSATLHKAQCRRVYYLGPVTGKGKCATTTLKVCADNVTTLNEFADSRRIKVERCDCVSRVG